MKISYEKSEMLMKLLAVLVDLGVVERDAFLAASIDVSLLVEIGNKDYLSLITQLARPEE